MNGMSKKKMNQPVSFQSRKLSAMLPTRNKSVVEMFLKRIRGNTLTAFLSLLPLSRTAGDEVHMSYYEAVATITFE